MKKFHELFFGENSSVDPAVFDPALANKRKETPFLEKGDTLVCFGDSLTQAAPGYMGRLTERLGAMGIKVINSGHGGDKTPLALMRMKQEVIDLHPTAVSIFLGTNDAAIGRGPWSDEPVVSPLTYKENLMWMVHLCRLYGKIEKFSICTISGRFEGSTYLQHGELNLAYNAMAREAADTMQTWIVPWDAVFNEYWRINGAKAGANGLLLSRDGTHLSDDGYALLAETMIRAWKLE